MGDPIDNPTGLLNPKFIGSTHWTWGNGWSYSPEHAIFQYHVAPGTLSQGNLKVYAGNEYRLGFMITEWPDPPGSAIVSVSLSGCPTEPEFFGVGDYKFDLFATETFDGTAVYTVSAFFFTPGQQAKIDFMLGDNLSPYLANTLGFAIPSPGRSELYPGTGAEYSQILASRNGKTNISILYDT